MVLADHQKDKGLAQQGKCVTIIRQLKYMLVIQIPERLFVSTCYHSADRVNRKSLCLGIRPLACFGGIQVVISSAADALRTRVATTNV